MRTRSRVSVWRAIPAEVSRSPLLGALKQLSQYAFLAALLKLVLARVGVFLALGEHGVDETRQLVGGSGHSLGLVHPRTHAPEVGAERRLAGVVYHLVDCPASPEPADRSIDLRSIRTIDMSARLKDI